MKPSEIPQTDSIEQLAKFWDAQDITNFEDELEEVVEPVFEQKTETTVTIRLHTQEATLLKKIASAQGLEDSVLLREWIREKLQKI